MKSLRNPKMSEKCYEHLVNRNTQQPRMIAFALTLWQWRRTCEVTIAAKGTKQKKESSCTLPAPPQSSLTVHLWRLKVPGWLGASESNKQRTGKGKDRRQQWVGGMGNFYHNTNNSVGERNVGWDKGEGNTTNDPPPPIIRERTSSDLFRRSGGTEQALNHLVKVGWVEGLRWYLILSCQITKQMERDERRTPFNYLTISHLGRLLVSL